MDYYEFKNQYQIYKYQTFIKESESKSCIDFYQEYLFKALRLMEFLR